MLIQPHPKIQQRLGLSLIEISTFCQQWQIVEMALFGSVLREDFQVDGDIDILVKFAPNAREGLLTLAKIKHELETGSIPILLEKHSQFKSRNEDVENELFFDPVRDRYLNSINI